MNAWFSELANFLLSPTASAVLVAAGLASLSALVAVSVAARGLWGLKPRMAESAPQPSLDLALLLVGRNAASRFEHWIEAFAASGLSSRVEMVVIDNQSEDDTAHRIEQLRLQHPWLTVVTVPHSDRFWRTRKLAMTLGVKATKRTNLVWVDAATVPPADLAGWLGWLTKPLADRSVAAVWGPVQVVEAKAADRIPMMAGQIWAWLRQHSGGIPTSLIPVNLAFRSSDFMDLKGFQDSMHVDGGEGELLLGVLKARGRIALAEEAVVARRGGLHRDPKLREVRPAAEQTALTLAFVGLLLTDLAGLAAAAGVLGHLIWVPDQGLNPLRDFYRNQAFFAAGSWVVLHAVVGAMLLVHFSRFGSWFEAVRIPFWLRWDAVRRRIPPRDPMSKPFWKAR
ncbi:MAG: hypothetical protein RIR07_461 [Bacteroidota bacterium]